MKALEDDADGLAPEDRKLVLAELGQDVPGDLDPARGRPFQARQQHQQRGLSAARRPDNGDDFGRLDRKIDVFEDVEGLAGDIERVVDARDGNDRLAGRRRRHRNGILIWHGPLIRYRLTLTR